MSHRSVLRVLAAIGVLASVGITVRVLASAPADQYSAFVAQSTTITDQKTKLTWERAGSANAATTYGNSVVYCTDLALPGTWRLPTENELLTLVDEDPHQQYEDAGLEQKAIDQSAFPTTASAPYATQTQINGKRMVIDFTTGATYGVDDNTPRFVRCVEPCTQNDAGACTP